MEKQPRQRLEHPLPTDPKPGKVYLSPELVSNTQPALDEPHYGFLGAELDETTCDMKVIGLGYVVIRAHADGVGISIFTDREVRDGTL